jgi:hypothetical protein
MLSTIEQCHDLAPLDTRDAAMNSLANVFDAHQALRTSICDGPRGGRRSTA